MSVFQKKSAFLCLRLEKYLFFREGICSDRCRFQKSIGAKPHANLPFKMDWFAVAMHALLLTKGGAFARRTPLDGPGTYD